MEQEVAKPSVVLWFVQVNEFKIPLSFDTRPVFQDPRGMALLSGSGGGTVE